MAEEKQLRTKIYNGQEKPVVLVNGKKVIKLAPGETKIIDDPVEAWLPVRVFGTIIESTDEDADTQFPETERMGLYKITCYRDKPFVKLVNTHEKDDDGLPKLLILRMLPKSSVYMYTDYWLWASELHGFKVEEATEEEMKQEGQVPYSVFFSHQQTSAKPAKQSESKVEAENDAEEPKSEKDAAEKVTEAPIVDDKQEEGPTKEELMAQVAKLQEQMMALMRAQNKPESITKDDNRKTDIPGCFGSYDGRKKKCAGCEVKKACQADKELGEVDVKLGDPEPSDGGNG